MFSHLLLRLEADFCFSVRRCQMEGEGVGAPFDFCQKKFMGIEELLVEEESEAWCEESWRRDGLPLMPNLIPVETTGEIPGKARLPGVDFAKRASFGDGVLFLR